MWTFTAYILWKTYTIWTISRKPGDSL